MRTSLRTLVHLVVASLLFICAEEVSAEPNQSSPSPHVQLFKDKGVDILYEDAGTWTTLSSKLGYVRLVSVQSTGRFVSPTDLPRPFLDGIASEIVGRNLEGKRTRTRAILRRCAEILWSQVTQPSNRLGGIRIKGIADISYSGAAFATFRKIERCSRR
jgi:hypothetical protein